MRKTLSVIGCGLLVAACGRASPLPASPTIEENQRAGGQGWKPDNPSRDLAAFVDRTSYLPGSAVEVHAGAASPTSVIWELWRLGYYGGAGGRMLLAGGPTEIPASTTAVLDGATGAVSAPWPMAFVVTIPATAPTGVYVVKLVSSAGSTFAPLVVREPVPRAPILYTVSTNTYQAYNTWGGTSLYVNRRSDWSAPRAYAVSFDRPYAAGAGTGDLWDKDRDFINFAEGQGYDMAYATDTDLDAQPDLVARRRMLVVQGHSEYWTAAMRDAFEAAIAARTNVAFFAANNAYWQVRFASDARRVLIGYKEFAALDPMAAVDPRRVTTKWRDPRVNRPENAMIGEMYGDWIWTGAPLVVADPSSWLWTGAGVDQGTAIPGVYGDEVDRRIDNGAQPAGVQVVGSGFVESQGTSFSSAETTVYTAPSGAEIFAAGSIYWSRALANVRTWDPRIQQAVANIFSRFAGDGTLGTAALKPLVLAGGAKPPSYRAGVQVTTVTNALAKPAAIAVAPNGDAIVADGDLILRITADGAVSTIAGSVRGARDGPAAQATFSGPRGIAVASNGDIHVSDTGNDRIRVISGGVVRTRAGGAAGFADGLGADALFSKPMGIALTADGKLLVADSGNQRLRAIETDGRVGTWSASLSLPVAVAVLPSGDAVVSDAATGLLRKVAATGAHAVTDFAGEIGRMGWNDGPLATASISETFALVARADGELILLDGASARVRAIRDGMVDTLAGGQQLGTRDGIGSAAAFACPRAAAVTPDGSLLVVDAREHALRRITFGP